MTTRIYYVQLWMYIESSRVKQMEMSAKCWSFSLAHHYIITDRRNNRVFIFYYFFIYFLPRRNSLGGPMAPRSRGFVITLSHSTLSRTPLDEWSARRRDLYITTHNTHSKHPCPRRDSNPQSQQATSRRPTPYTARPLGGFLVISWPKTKGNQQQYAA